MITVKKIIPPTIHLYSPDNSYLGELNEYEFLDARVQIKNAQESGYYFRHLNQKVRIDRNGELESYPDGVLSLMSDYYLKLL